MTRLEQLRAMLARVQLEIEREEAYQRRMSALRVDYKTTVNRGDWTSRIIAAAAAHYGVSGEQVVGASRKQNIIDARHIACWLLRDAGRTWPEIGRRIGKDHATAINGARRVENDPVMLAQARIVRELLCGEAGAA